jgi:hypothetical protein
MAEAPPQATLAVAYNAGIAVDNSGGSNSGDLYIAGTKNGLVYRYDPAGKYLAELGGSATPAGSFRPTGVAVDSSGDLYVADEAHKVIDRFDATGKYVSQLSITEISSPATMALDSSGNIYLTNFSSDPVEIKEGGSASVLDTNGSWAVGVDPATGHVLVGEPYVGPDVAEYDSADKRVGSFGEERVGYVLGLAGDSATGQVVVSDYNPHDEVDVYGPTVVVPDVISEPATSVLPSGATLNGSVNPDGAPVTGCRFEYGTSPTFGLTAPCAQSPATIGEGTSPVPVSAAVSLQPDTGYYFRLVASNGNGTSRGPTLAFTTPGPPRVDAESVDGIQHTAATIHA